MKTPLRYQITEYDCGSVSLVNCITYLFERNEIPAELIKVISTFTLDCYDEKGRLGAGGTIREMIYFISRWIDEFSEQKSIPLDAKYLKGKSVELLAILKCLKAGGCVNLRTYNDGAEHYITLTGYDNEYIYLFDPYYRNPEEFKGNDMIDCIVSNAFSYNRRVRIEQFVSDKKLNFALGPVDKREAVLFNRNDISMQIELA